MYTYLRYIHTERAPAHHNYKSQKKKNKQTNLLETKTQYSSGHFYISKTDSESSLKGFEWLNQIINFYMQGLAYNFPLTRLSLYLIPFFVISFLSDKIKIISKVRSILWELFPKEKDISSKCIISHSNLSQENWRQIKTT